VGSTVAGELLANGADEPVLLDVAFSHENLADRLDLDAVRLVEADVTDVDAVRRIVESHDIDCIIHTAAILHRGVGADPVRGVDVNVMGMVSVLEAARRVGIRRVVNCSAASVVLGKVHPRDTSVPENVSLACVDDRPPNIYSTAKLAAEWLCSNYRDQYGVSAVTVRAAGTFGPWIGSQRGHPAGLMRAIVEGGLREGVVRLPGDDIGLAIDFVYSHDVAHGLVLAANHPDPPSQVYNVSMGVSHSVPEIVEILGTVLQRTVSIEASSETSVAMFPDPAPAFDLQLSRAELGYEPQFPMPTALAHFAEWVGRHLTA
jgi:nucleoside-diphosphate-sugar epimerase